MHVLSATDLGHGFDGRSLFSGLTFGLTTEDRVAVVGPNGCGKSTLLAIVAGLVRPDAGAVSVASGARITHLAQEPSFAPDATALAVAAADATVAPHEAEALLDRLQVAPDATLHELSGGQRRRVALAAALLVTSDLLILDEPTNHLDADTIDWLEERLRGRAGGLLVVTHDRRLLQRLATRILDLNDTPTWIDGTYADVVEARLRRREARTRADQRRRNLLRKELAWLRRGPQARTSKPKFRLEQAATLMEPGAADDVGVLALGTGRRRLGTKVLESSGLTVRFGERTVLDGVSLDIGPGERVGIVGPNGAGKTTLLRVLAGDLAPTAGTVTWGPTVEQATYAQVVAAPSAVRVIDTITDIAEWVPLASGERLAAGRLAERFGFDTRLQQAAVADLSGGERRRLALLHVLVRAPNVLLLDEPTNDLDIETLQALEDHLDGFRGTLIVASHDRFVLDRLTDRVVAIEDGRLVDYLDWDAYRDAARDRSVTPRRASGPSASAHDNRLRQEQRRRLRSLDQRIARLSSERAQTHAALAAIGADYERAATLDATARQLDAEISAAEDEWLTLALALGDA